MIAPVPLLADLTPAWLGDALGRTVTGVDTELVGTGQMGSCHRLRLHGDPDLPATVLAKLPLADAAARAAMAFGYTNEIRFYRELADTVDIRVPACHYAGLGDAGVFTLLLEDLAPARVGDQLAGCTPAQATAAAVNLAGLHGPRWNDSTLLEIEGMLLPTKEISAMSQLAFTPTMDTFLTAIGDTLTPADVDTLRAVTPHIGDWMSGRAERHTLLHMDYRLDNLLFGADGTVFAVDWQGMSVGLGGRDVAFFLSTSLSIADRRAHEREIVGAYHARLLDYGVTGHPLDQCWDDYRYGMLQTIFITVFGLVLGARTERGDRMFRRMIEGGCTAIRDLDVLALLEQPAGPQRPPTGG
ncbi:phosphotransferase [Skermania piniformis]|uniref:Ecdysteroid 22-kinase family protein n=1 Tax=Skermania pinensis TaxID=39122 RepID=A0ABX8S859_9ACTN|nr:phosphotransferase [Skermania piniformis]QXQ14043.1 ecdysteroid 22-kinase family protein [Skermania piniformis]